MTNNQLYTQTITFRPPAQLKQRLDIELDRKDEIWKEFLGKKDHVAILRFNGGRFIIRAIRVLLDDNSRLKSEFEKLVLADAVQQAVRKQYPERNYVQVEITGLGGNDEEGYYEYQAHVWWNHRRQYEQYFFYIRY